MKPQPVRFKVKGQTIHAEPDGTTDRALMWAVFDTGRVPVLRNGRHVTWGQMADALTPPIVLEFTVRDAFGDDHV